MIDDFVMINDWEKITLLVLSVSWTEVGLVGQK